MKNVTNQTRVLRKFEASAPWRSVPKPAFPAVPVNEETFVIENDEATTSSGFHRFGLCFKKGDIPKYTSVEIYRNDTPVPAQFDQRVTWNDGSLKYAVCSIRDTDFSASESRTYEWRQSYKPFDNTGTKSLTDVTTNTDFNVELTNNQRYNGTSNEADPVGATLTASFNDHAAVATRVTKTLDPVYGDRIHSGPICETWEVWGMCKNGSDTEHAHLKTVWLVTAWKDAGDNIVDYEYGATIAQDWWGVASKYRQDYDLALKDGATTIQSYTGIQHPYHSQWFTVDLDARNTRYAKRHFKTNAPTLHYKPNLTYWIKSKVLPILDISEPGNSDQAYTTTWAQGSALGHNTAIDAGGDSLGRGLLPNSDAVSLLSGSSTRAKNARTIAHAGLHVPYHFKQDRTRTRQGESADVANTNVLNILAGSNASSFDKYDRLGLPQPQYAYGDISQTFNGNADRTEVEYQDNYVAPLGGMGVWGVSGDASHAVMYSYAEYLVSGERYMLNAQTDLAFNTIHQQTSGPANPQLLYYTDAYRRTELSIPVDRWEGVVFGGQQTRSFGWGAYLVATGSNIIPTDEPIREYYDSFVDHNLEYLKASWDYLPQSQKDMGLVFDYSENGHRPWMAAFMAIGFGMLYGATENTNLRTIVEGLGRYFTNGFASLPATDCYVSVTLPRPLLAGFSTSGWVSGTNEYIDNSQNYMAFGTDGISCTSSVFTYPTIYTGGGFSADSYTVTDGDKVILWEQNGDNGAVRPLPSGYEAGRIYNVINATATTFQIEDPANLGNPLTVGDETGMTAFFDLQDARAKTVISAGDDISFYNGNLIASSAAHVLNHVGVSTMSDADIDRISAYLANVTLQRHFKWAIRGRI